MMALVAGSARAARAGCWGVAALGTNLSTLLVGTCMEVARGGGIPAAHAVTLLADGQAALTATRPVASYTPARTVRDHRRGSPTQRARSP